MYWGFLIFGIIFAALTIVFDDILGHLFDGLFDFLQMDGLDFLHPMVLVGGTTVFGGAGVLFTRYTDLAHNVILFASVLIAVFISIMVYFFYVKPMKNSENSTGFSMQDTIGRIGEVNIPIPAVGYGEVIIKMGVFNTNHIAASFDKEEIPTGTRVVVIEIKDDALMVSRLEEDI